VRVAEVIYNFPFNKIYFQKKKGKKRKPFHQPPYYKPKGNGINPWIHTVELLDAACAGYIAEDMY
jgi:hypothetical protein